MPQSNSKEDQSIEGHPFQKETSLSSNEMDEQEMTQNAFMPVYCSGILHKKCNADIPGSTVTSQKNGINPINENHLLLKSNNCYQIHFVETAPPASDINSTNNSQNHNHNHNDTKNNSSSSSNVNNNNTVQVDNMLLSPSLQLVEVAPHFSKVNLTPDQQYTKIHSNITLVSQSGIRHTIIPLHTVSPYCIIEGITSSALPCVFTRSPSQQAFIKLSNAMIQSSAINTNKPHVVIQHATQKASVLHKSSQMQLFSNSLANSTNSCQDDMPKVIQNNGVDKDASEVEQKKLVLQNTSKDFNSKIQANNLPKFLQSVKQLEVNKKSDHSHQCAESINSVHSNSCLEPSQQNSGDTLPLKNQPDELTEKDKTPNYKIGTDLDSSFDYTIEAERMVSSLCSTSPTKEKRTNDKDNAHQDVADSPKVYTSDIIADSTFSAGNILLDALHKSVALKELMPSPCLQKVEEDWSKNTTSCTIGKTVFNQVNMLSDKMGESNYLLNSKDVSINNNFSDTVNPKINCLNSVISNKETILFKETAIKCCFDIEKIIQSSELKYKHIGTECNDVRHSIFISNGFQKPDHIIDISSGILLLIKSWVNLNRQFENFRLDSPDQNNLHDSNVIKFFMQWQCASKSLIETLTSNLRNDSNDSETKINENFRLFSFQNEERNEKTNRRNSLFSQKSYVKDFTNADQQNTIVPTFQMNVAKKDDESMRSINSTYYWDANCYSYLPKISQPLQTSFHKDLKTSNKLNANTRDYQQHNLLNKKTFGSFANGNSESNYCKYSTDDKTQNLSFMKESSIFSSKTVEPFLMQNSSNPISHFYNSTDFKNKISPLVNNDFQANAMLKKHSTLPNGFKQNTSTPIDLTLSPSSVSSNHEMLPLQYTNYDGCYQFSNSQQKCTLNQMSHLGCLNPNSNLFNFNSDDSENVTIKITYLKPGSYNTPQKTTCPRTINNNFIIEDPPVSGVQFLYTNSQTNIQKLYPSTNENSIITNKSDSISKKTEETWKAALASAESLCETLMTNKSSKSSETATKSKLARAQNNTSKFTTPDMYTDSNAKTSSQKEVTELKIDSPPFPLPESKFKIDDWLMQTKSSILMNPGFGLQTNTNNSENSDCNMFLKQIVQSDKSSSSSNEDILSNFDFKLTYNIACKTTDVTTQHDENKTFSILKNDKMSSDPKTTARKKLTPRKFKKNPKEDFAFGSSNKYNTKRINTINNMKENKTINQQTMTKLLEILDVVWKTDIKSLTKPVNNSDKDIENLESKIRCPLFLQAINYKLQSQGYESVDNVLIDFKKFFDQTRETNKGDEVCTEIVNELEKMYNNLVEKHFGVIESSECKQNFGPVGSIPNIKIKKQKRTQRKS